MSAASSVSSLSQQAFVCRANDSDAAGIEAAALEVPIHDVGDGHVGIEVVEDRRSARAAPGGDATSGDARPVDLDDGRVLQHKAEAPLDVEIEKPVLTLGLNVEYPLAALPRQQTHAVHLAAAREHGLRERHRACVAVAVAAAQIAAPPGDGARGLRRAERIVIRA